MDSDSSNQPPSDPTIPKLQEVLSRAVRDIDDYWRSLGDEGAWRRVPDELRAAFNAPVPNAPTDIRLVYQKFRDEILPYQRGNANPRFWGWANGSGLPVGALADFLASATNSTLGSGDNAPMLVEEQVVRWLCQSLRLSDSHFGLLTSGCSVSNLIALAAARDRALQGHDVRQNGMRSTPPLGVYVSSQTHFSVSRACHVLGLGTASVRKVRVDSRGQIDTDHLRALLHRDLEEGVQPACIVANFGAVETGASDDVEVLGGLAREFRTWLHIDAAFGVAAKFDPSHAQYEYDLSLADSLSFDLHKSLFLPYDVGCVLVRDQAALKYSFAAAPTYMQPLPNGPLDNDTVFADLGVEQSRRFRALKVWFAFRVYGLDGLAQMTRAAFEGVRYFESLISSSSVFEVVSPAQLNVVCFGVGSSGSVSEKSVFNRRLLNALQERGNFIVSNAVVDGLGCLRLANNNHRSTTDHFDALFVELTELASNLHHD